MDIFLARQPIFNKLQKTSAYELLFRGGLTNAFPEIDGDVASSKVLSHSFFTLGMDQITYDKRAFVNFSQNLLEKKIPFLFPRERLVVEILENVLPTGEVISSCREMAAAGYTIALDDFVLNEDIRPLIDIASIIKFDFRATPAEEISRCLTGLSKYRKLRFLAEKIETSDEFHKALSMGFEYFQGYFFAKPQIIQGKDIPPIKMNLLQIIAEAHSDDFDFSRLEKYILQDVSISYKLLRYINSAFFRRMNEITSIRQALILMGEREVKRFISLLVISRLAPGKPDELIMASIIRAKLCELLAKRARRPISDSEAFTMGLFSLIDAILDQEMEQLMEKLPLASPIKAALTAREGPLTELLSAVEAYEHGDWQSFEIHADSLALDKQSVPACYGEAVGWAEALASIQ